MSKSPSTARPAKPLIPAFVKIAVLLAVVLSALFYRSYEPGVVAFSNDGPLGQIAAPEVRTPATLTGGWLDLNSIGSNFGASSPDVSSMLLLLPPVIFAKFYPLVALFILGLGGWAFFRKLKLSPLASALGALAVMLNTQFFSGACWGVASDQIALGFNFFAMALVLANDDESSVVVFWTRLALAGLCIGINVMEAADVGALCSVFVALFIFYKSLIENAAPIPVKIGHGVARVAVVAVFAGFIAVQTVVTLISTQIQGVAVTNSSKDNLQHWDFATQWSLPKQETLGILVPGLFGYRMDTPMNTVPFLQHMYAGGTYWGGMGRDPQIDRYFDSGGRDNPPAALMRFGYGGYYCGILVALVVFWAVAQSFRKKDSPFTDLQKKFIWFWSVIIVLSLLVAWGRFAPLFYGFLYLHVPYFSTIRNPAKFLDFVEWSLTVLFAYGIHGIGQRYLSTASSAAPAAKVEDKTVVDQFDRRWLYVVAGTFAACVLAWLKYSSKKDGLVQYLKYRGFPDDDVARAIASFSISQAGWFLLLFAIALVLLAIIMSGSCSGSRAKWAAAALGLFLVFDLGRADLPFIIHWNIKQKYEVGDLNPIVDFLRQDPYQHRVALLPFNPPPGQEGLSELYGIEWTQHLFPYYDIQTLDIIQMPRMPADLEAYQMQAFIPQDPSQAYLYARLWQLTNTRYLLGSAGFIDPMNSQLDPVQHRFQILRRFNLNLKPGIDQYDGDSSEITAVADDNGPYALFEFTGALPRAKLYTSWQTNSPADLKSFSTNALGPLDYLMFSETGTNGFITLKKLGSPSFDPEQSVLLDAPLPQAVPAATNNPDGTVQFESYSPKSVVLDANAVAPSVLLLNDHYDPNWHVTVDGRPAQLFHANFIMQGVFVPPGKHTIHFYFNMPTKPLYVTVFAYCIGIILCGVIVFYKRPAMKPAPARKF